MRGWKPVGVAGLLAAVVVGCGQQGGEPAKPDAGQVKEKAGHDHSGWWCDEHGIPEAECSMCSGRVARRCKANGDWCDLHERAKSQCFVCDPSLKAEFAKRYKAKEGKEPPEPEGWTDPKAGKKA